MQADITHHLKNSQAFLLILIYFSICWLTIVLGMEEEIIHDIRTKMWKVNGFDMTAIAYKTWSNSNHSYN